MQIHRLFEILYLLLEQENITAKELAERFEVSPRTIHRDIDVLSGAGVPVYAVKGKGGGIRLLPGFVLNKSLLSQADKNQLLMGLQNLAAVEVPDADEVLRKMGAVLGRSQTSWLEVDFSPWNGSLMEKERFLLIRDGVVQRQLLEFDYYNQKGEQSHRQVEPLKLLFKGQSWYLYGYCRERLEERAFKLKRMEQIELLPGTEGSVSRTAPEQLTAEMPLETDLVSLLLRADRKLSYRIYDEFSPEQIERCEDGSLLIRVKAPDKPWLYDHLHSMGEWVEVLEPPFVRQEMKARLKRNLNLYL